MSSRPLSKFVLFFLLSSCLILTGCEPTQNPPPTPVVGDIKAVPETTVMIGSQLTLNIDVTGENIRYRWEAQQGSLINADTSIVTYQAPTRAGEDLVKVHVIYGDDSEIQRSLIIHVVEPTPTQTPVPTDTPIPTQTPIPTATPIPSDTPSPTPSPVPDLLVEDFEKGQSNQNNLGGSMGAAYSNPNIKELVETYVEAEGHGYVVHLEYNLRLWAGFFLQLKGIDLTQYRSLAFDWRSLTGAGNPAEIKIDLSRPNQCSVARVSGVESTWKTIRIPFKDFGSGSCKYSNQITAWDQMEELVFVLELSKAGKTGIIELDNIRFEP